jgi:hypothetical protein
MEATDDHLATVDAEFDRLARPALLAIIGAALAYNRHIRGEHPGHSQCRPAK